MKRRSSRPRTAKQKIIRQKFTAEVAVTFEYSDDITAKSAREVIRSALSKVNAPIKKTTIRSIEQDSRRVLAA